MDSVKTTPRRAVRRLHCRAIGDGVVRFEPCHPPSMMLSSQAMGAAADTGAETAGTELDLDRSVDPRAVAVWRWSAAMTFTPLVGAASVLVVSASIARSPGALVLWIGWLLLLTAAGTYVWKYPPARHRHLRYRIDDVGITIRDGVLWRTWSAVPRVRIQHTDVSQGPLQRRYGVAELKLYTAGSRFTRIDLPGLEHAVALALRDDLQRSANDDAV
jgi:membrane protein YdbS with pleckstrin-like domain